MGGNNSNYSGVNQMAQNQYNSMNQQRNDFQSALYGGLAGAQGRSDQVFNAAFGGYNDLLKQIQGGMGGGGGDISAALATLQGMGGPGNPWAGQLGADVRAREDSLLPGFYDRIKSEQTRLQNIQGGYNPGFTSQMSKLARDQAQQAQAAKLNTEIEIGKQSAAAQAAQAAFENQKAMAIANLQAQQGMAGAANRRALMGMNLSALGGLSNLRTDTPGEVGMYLQAALGNLGQGQQLGNQAMGQLMDYNPKGLSGWQQAMGLIGGLAPGIGSLFSFGRGRQQYPTGGMSAWY